MVSSWLDEEGAKVPAGGGSGEAEAGGEDESTSDAGDGDPEGHGPTGDPIETTLEWGVRSLGKPVEVNAEGDLPARATADLFPAYDDDGGLLLVLTPSGS